MGESLTEFAGAKVNLFLHVGAPEADGFHPLESLVAFATFGDQLILTPSDDLGFSVSGPFAAGLNGASDNLVTRARDAMLALAGHEDAAFHLELLKDLPVASGIGGGSADAAATMRLLKRVLRFPAHRQADAARLSAIARELGSDVPVCFAHEPAIMRGRGEQLFPPPVFPDLPCVLVNPGVPTPTGEVFRAYDRMGAGALPPLPEFPDAFRPREAAAALANFRNDLEAPAIGLCPSIGEVLDALRAQSMTLMARMSGSGATCFALCVSDEDAEMLAYVIKRRHEAWWVQPCRLKGVAP
ncbi:MAG: 4-(cytidine 5'-diphospho)-2-C-methyl-D-erythritol kinase [Caulobacteraceae bacterium]